MVKLWLSAPTFVMTKRTWPGLTVMTAGMTAHSLRVTCTSCVPEALVPVPAVPAVPGVMAGSPLVVPPAAVAVGAVGGLAEGILSHAERVIMIRPTIMTVRNE